MAGFMIFLRSFSSFPRPGRRIGFVMSMQPQPWPEVPAQTARVARAAFRKGSLAIRARDQLGAWYDDAAFAGAYGVRGAPGISPAQLAMVTVLQFTENLTDRQAADAVRGRLDWKYCLGLALTDEGFDFSVLSEFRDRLAAGGLERSLFELLLARVKERGLVKAGGRQRTDSTHVLGRIRELNRLELAGEAVRAALEALAAAAPGWLATVIGPSWQQVYGQRIDSMRLPGSQARRAALAVQYGTDGYRLLAAVRAPGAPPWAAGLPAVEALRRIWIQQYYRVIDAHGEKVMRREAHQHGLPPGRSRVISPYDTAARYGEKRGRGWNGYKIHLTESCHQPGPAGWRAAPNLITHVATTPASAADMAMTSGVHDGLQACGLTPAEHLVDAGYACADSLVSAQQRGIALIGPLRATATAAARSGGYTAQMFTIDWDCRQATCPQGVASVTWHEHTASQGRGEAILVRFPASACRACPARAQCTTARGGRTLGLRPRPIHQAVTAARAAQATPAWKRTYAARAGVEGTIWQATHVTGIRRARYTGLAKTSLEHNTAAAAINLIRLDSWWAGTPLDQTRTTHLQRLQLTTA
jgi:transposase